MKHSKKTKTTKKRVSGEAINKRGGSIIDKLRGTIEAVVEILETTTKGVDTLSGSTFQAASTGVNTVNSAVALPGTVLDATGKMVKATGDTGVTAINTTGELINATGKTSMNALHLWTFKTPIFTELKKSKNVKSIMMVLLFPLLFWLLKR
jgi:hypothetical protein